MCKTKKILSLDLISLVSGLMRTGKTYSVVYHLLAVKDDYHIFTNIQGLKNFYDLNTSEFVSKVKILHSYYNDLVNKGVDNLDDLLRERQKELEFFYYEDKEALLVIDECQNILSKKDSSLVWFFTYLARFKMRILLITQNPTLLDSSYTRLIIEYYSTVQLQKVLNNKSFKIRRYSNITDLTYNKNVIENISVPKLQCVFEQYSTPKFISKSKSLLRAYYKYIIVGLFLLFFALFSIYKSFTDKIKPVNNSVVSVSKSLKAGNRSVSVYDYVFCDLNYCMKKEDYEKNVDDYGKYGIIKVINKDDLVGKCGGKYKHFNTYLLDKKKGDCYEKYSYFVNL